MVEEFIDSLIDNEFKKKDFFTNYEVFEPSYKPPKIQYRDEQQKDLLSGFSPLIRGQKSRNIFCFGKHGTGKTLTTNYTLKKIKEAIEKKNKSNPKNKIKEMDFYTFNCKISGDTLSPYQLIQNMLSKLGNKIPTGYSTKNMYNFFFDFFKDVDKNVVLVFDELDAFIKKNSDELLYALLRVHEEYPDVKAKFSIVGISNRSELSSLISAKNKTMLNPIAVTFPPYNANQLLGILEDRVKLGLRKNCLDEQVIHICSAIGARDNGDARKTIGYLKSCVELSLYKGFDVVSSELIDEAVKKADLDEVFSVIKTLPKQEQLVLYSILKTNKFTKTNIDGKKTSYLDYSSVNSVYSYYENMAKKTIRNTPLSLRQVREIITSFDEEDGSGLVSSRIDHKGRNGRTKLVKFDYPVEIRERVLEVLRTELYID